MLTPASESTRNAVQRLRPSIALRIVGGLSVVASLGIMTASLVSSRDRGNVAGVFMGVLLSALPLLGGVRLGLTPFLAWDQSVVTIRNPFLRRVIPWSDVERVLPGQITLGFKRRTGRSAWAWAVQRANASAPGKSRVDRVAAMLEEFRVSASSGATAATGTRKIEIPWPELVLLTIYAAVLTWHIFG